MKGRDPMSTPGCLYRSKYRTPVTTHDEPDLLGGPGTDGDTAQFLSLLSFVFLTWLVYVS